LAKEADQIINEMSVQLKHIN